MSRELPERSQIVVIGGGILGCSTAYHLVRRGWKDVVVLEKAQLTSGTSWHAAGSVGQLRSNIGITQMIGYSTQLYGRLEAETGQATGWVQCGSIRLACTPERKDELERSVMIGRSIGLDIRMISPDEVKAMIPVVSLEGVLGAIYIPTDGMINPSDVTMALAKGARMEGARIFENTKVTGFVRSGDRVTAIETTGGTIACDKVVLCGGVWAREVGRLAGVNVPLQANYNQYAITDVIPGLPRGAPDLRDPDNYIYFKEEVGGYAFGNYDQEPQAYEISPIPEDHAFHLFEPELDHFTLTVDAAVMRIPALAEVGIKRFIHGLESFTEDGMPIMGEAPELRDFFLACGFNGFGIASGGGAGKAMADWITDGQPPYDLGAADIRRFSRHHGSDQMVKQLAIDGQRRHYALARPSDEAQMARTLRRSPVYAALALAGARFTPVAGWEVAEYFDGEAGADVDDLVNGEYIAAKRSAILVDDSSRAKFAIMGPGAEAALRNLFPACPPLTKGRISTGFALTPTGGIDCEVTITPLEDDNFVLTTSASRGTYLQTFIRHGLAKVPEVRWLDVTAGTAVFVMSGPAVLEILEPLIENAIPRPGTSAIEHGYLAGAPVRLVAATPFGEPGVEVHVSSDYAAYVFEALLKGGAGGGAAGGLRLAGSRAIDRLRIENGIPAFGNEIDGRTKPCEIGVAAGTGGETAGRSLKRFLVEGSAYRPKGREGLFAGDQRVGSVTSAAFSPIADGSFVLAFVDKRFADSGLELETHDGKVKIAGCGGTHSEH